MTIIKFENVHFGYSKNHSVLNGVNFKIDKNEKVGILGESGAGKSTLSSLILGELNPTRGQVKVNSKRVFPVFQHAFESFDRHYTIQQSLEEPLIFYNKMKSSDIKPKLLNYLESFGLAEHLLQKFPREVSGGQLQRLNIIRSLISQPDILICDEITSNLDVVAEQNVIDIIINEDHINPKTLLVISHDLSVIQRLTQRVIVLKDGEVVDDFKIEDLFDKSRHPYSQLLINSME